MTYGLYLVPVVDWKVVRAFITEHHRHHDPPPGHLWSVGVAVAGRLVGVATVGRPVSRALQNGVTVEVTRSATDGTRNANSKLYAACAQAAYGRGFARAVTYTQDQCERCRGRFSEHPINQCDRYVGETGASLRAAGWVPHQYNPPRPGWDMPSRPRRDRGAGDVGRIRWHAPHERALPSPPFVIPTTEDSIGRQTDLLAELASAA